MNKRILPPILAMGLLRARQLKASRCNCVPDQLPCFRVSSPSISLSSVGSSTLVASCPHLDSRQVGSRTWHNMRLHASPLAHHRRPVLCFLATHFDLGVHDMCMTSCLL